MRNRELITMKHAVSYKINIREIGEIACPNIGLALELWRPKKISIYALDISRSVADYDRQYV